MDQLHSEADDMFSWLPKHLPTNVKVIISSHSESTRVTCDLMERISSSCCCVEIQNLNMDECDVLLSHFLGRLNRTITSKQMQELHHVFQKCSAPIFIKLLANQLKVLHSFDGINIEKLPLSIEEALDFLLTQLENKHGRVFVAKCLGYLVASKTGLSDCEIEDVLSLDDEVLNEVYTEYQPPIRRISSVRWLYLKDGLEGFLCSFDTDGVAVNMVKHTCLTQIIAERYLHTPETVQKQHSVLADYFLGSWCNIAKPVHLTSSAPTFPGTEAIRYVISQPLTFRTNGLVRFNKRKYDQLPRHLKGAERLQEMNRLVFFNYEWTYNKIKALSLEHIFEDFALNPSEEASLVKEALRQAQAPIEVDIDNLGAEIIGRLLPYYSDHKNIRGLIQQCELDGLSNCCLIPNLPYFNTPGSALKSTMNCPVVPEFFALINSDRQLVCKKREDCYVYIYQVSSGKLKDRVFASNGDMYVTPNGDFLAIVDHVTEAAIKIHDVKTGTFLGQIVVMSCLEETNGGTVGQIRLSNDTLCTFISSNYSYLCLADLQSCTVTKVIKLEGKITFCQISPDFRYAVCNSDKYIHCYDLKTYMENFKMCMDFLPCCVTFSRDMTLAYVTSSESPNVNCMIWKENGMDLLSKRNVEDDTNGSLITDVRVSPDNNMVLARSKHIIFIFTNNLQEVLFKFIRPDDIPQEFKLPKRQYQDMFFTDARFSCDSRFVIGTIFRAIYVWRLDGGPATSVHAPVGVISSLIVSNESRALITHTEGLPEVHVWDISTATKKIVTTDKLTSRVERIAVADGNNLIFVQCEKSDEIGIIDMKTSMVVDLLTHAKNVKDFTITPSGNYILVTMEPRISNSAINIWDTRSRSIVREFGNTAVKCIPCHQNEMFYFMCQDEVQYEAPYFVHSINLEEEHIVERKHLKALKYLLDEPFITPNDTFLVALSAEHYDETTGEYVNIAICIFNLCADMQLVCHSPSTIPTPHNIDAFVALKSCEALENTIAIFYQPQQSQCCGFDSLYTPNDAKIGICLFDIVNGCVTNIFEPLLCTVNKSMISQQLFSNDFSLCLTDQGTLVNLQTRRESKLACFSKQRLLAVNNTMVVYHEGSVLFAYRISSKSVIGRCEVHSVICYLKLCSDDHTILVGCYDGTVTSYTVINEEVDYPKEIISKILSRQSEERRDSPDDTFRTWDKLNKDSKTICPRPPSARSFGAKDKQYLQNIEPILQTRPISAGSTYSITNSKTCSIM